MVRWGSYRLVAEEHVKEVVKDVKFLHNGQYFAAAQRKYAYIYDKRGIEIHCLKDHVTPNALEFLPHHFLLCSIGEQGVLRYQDVTHGALVAQHRTKLGACEVMRHNPQNAIVHCGHGNGTVTLWSPNAGHAQVKMLCHRGPIRRVFFSSRRSPFVLLTLALIRPRSRGARRSLKSFSPVDRLSPSITPRF
jgi:U3 small nucleolar RNA-associated protein 7